MSTTSPYKTDTAEFRGRWIHYVYELQEKICDTIEATDGKAVFQQMIGNAQKEKAVAEERAQSLMEMFLKKAV